MFHNSSSSFATVLDKVLRLPTQIKQYNGADTLQGLYYHSTAAHYRKKHDHQFPERDLTPIFLMRSLKSSEIDNSGKILQEKNIVR